MRLPFGITISRRKAAAPPGSRAVDGEGRGWFSLWNWSNHDRELGSWQRDERMSDDSIFAQATVFTCMTLIASDISKMFLRIVQRYGRVWLEKTVEGLSDLLDTPNHFQTRQQFIESWVLSKLSRGNTYVLKVRDRRGQRPKQLIVLNPDLVTPLVAPNGDVFYQLGGEDILAGITDATIAVPAGEIIHDRFNCLFHPLVGLSPIFASGLAATQALRIQQASAKFFRNMARPGGMLTAPARISDDTAKRLKDNFEKNFEGENQGRLFVAGDGLKFDPLSVNAVDSEVVAQLEWSAKTVCATYHVPPYMAGAAEPPALNNIEAEQQRYYSQCLQALIEAIEACLDQGLDLKKPVQLADGSAATLAADFNVNDLLRMDSERRMAVLEKGVKGIMKPDEAREALNLLPTDGGDAVYMQQQNYSLAALAKRDAQEDPFGKAAAPPPSPAPAPPPIDDEAAKAFAAAAREQIEEGGRAVVAEVRDQAAGVLKAAGDETGRALQAAADAAQQQLGQAEAAAAASVSAAVGTAAQAAEAGIAGAAEKGVKALTLAQQQAGQQHTQVVEQGAAVLKDAAGVAAAQIVAAGEGVAADLKAHAAAAEGAAEAIATATLTAAAGATDSVTTAAKEAADAVRAAGEAAQAAIGEAAAAAARTLSADAQALLEPVLATLREQAAAAKASTSSEEDDLEDLAARVALALETADA